MKKIVTAFLCALLLSALPVLAAQPDAPPSAAIAAPAAHALPVAAEIATDLKLQQQKLESFKERLQMQDERIGDLGLMIGFFGALITITVVFFSIRSIREAVGAARDEAQKEIKQRAKEYIEAGLRPEVDKALKGIQEVASKTLDDLQKEHEDARELNARQRTFMDELASIPFDKNKLLTPEQKQELKEAVNNTKSVPPNEYRFSDWYLLGIQAFEQGKYEISAEHFNKAATIAVSPMDRAKALIDKAVTFGKLLRSKDAIVAYDEVVKHYGDASETALREQVARALVNKGITLSQQHSSKKEAIAVYDELVKRYGDAPEPVLREMVARALVDKGVKLGELQLSEEAIATYDEVVKRYGNAPELVLREMVAVAKAKVQKLKHTTLDQRQPSEEKEYEALKRYGDAPEPMLRKMVAKAQDFMKPIQPDKPD